MVTLIVDRGYVGRAGGLTVGAGRGGEQKNLLTQWCRCIEG